MDAALVLEDGTVFPGRSVGAPGVAAGEACFTTAAAGYEQSVTDPSYARQVLTFASPLVGNYGVDEALLESGRVWTEGVAMRRARPQWSAWLAGRGVVALDEVDTRALVRRLREDGAMRCALGTASRDELHARALAQPHLDWPRMLAEPALASPPPAL
ncbi:MAG: carbamoyl phosphate synthase small subunit, partial [Thermoleophilia bacterium]|nr:carbamoyl phosphate synthase small subunit [Thermoleophilia bacterium]